MRHFVIDMDDPREKWDELYRALERAAEPCARTSPPVEDDAAPPPRVFPLPWTG